MAGTRFGYVRSFELPDPLLPNTFLVLRVDGHGFHKSVPFFISFLSSSPLPLFLLLW